VNWAGVQLTGPPILIAGLRDRRQRLTGQRLNVDIGVHADLEAVGTSTLARFSKEELKPVPYTPYIGQADGEYLTIDPGDLVATVHSEDDDGTPTERKETAALVDLIERADELPEIGAAELLDRLDTEDFYFQAICMETGNGRIGFVTKSSKMQVLKRSGSVWLAKDDQNDRFTGISKPQIMLESRVHAIIGPSEVAILNRSQFQFLVSDVRLVQGYAPAQVRRIAKAFAQRGVPLSAATAAAIEQKATGSIQLAKRLDAFAERIDSVDVARIASGAGFMAQDLAKDDFVNASGEIECAPDRVQELLDALEGRYFDDPFSPEKRRADRFRRRPG
jgi:hypothetical protein